ncbi:uncharacterized protein UTRI_02350 [Ustilago trichophora]|uniref:Uncharacterized protein n=1 Tax=Ustilago trichophora TaxID=86804 RepID=A0A5C3E908_9BASI|nr:uncharacterized protein UTRI_02350 [Ustilago trichophora]
MTTTTLPFRDWIASGCAAHLPFSNSAAAGVVAVSLPASAQPRQLECSRNRSTLSSVAYHPPILVIRLVILDRNPDSSQTSNRSNSIRSSDMRRTLLCKAISSHRQEPSQGSPTTAAASQLTKLDGVIYHFYTATANLIIQARLAHLRSFLLTAPLMSLPLIKGLPRLPAHHRKPSSRDGLVSISRTPTSSKTNFDSGAPSLRCSPRCKQSNRLAAKIEALKAIPDKRNTDTETSASSQEIRVSDALPPERGLGSSSDEEFGSLDAGQSSSHGHYAIRTLAPIATPIGQLELSVTYRKLASFSVEDAESLRNANGIKIDLDEDYFRAPQSWSFGRPISDIEQARDRPSSTSQFPALTQQRIGGISAMRPTTLAAQRSSPDSATGAEALMSQSPANASVFSSSAPGRHSAGLSSLRRTGSNKSNLSLMGPANPSPAPSSPALAAALSAEPAFVAPSSVRRPSTSERRLRTLSGLGSGRPSPPVSPASATFELPEAGTSLPRSTSAAFSTSATGRTISTRTTSGFAATATGSMGPPSSQPRPSVSFSPSSPSPLAYQMSLQGSRSGGGPGLAPNVSQSTSSFRSVSGSGLRSSMSGTGVLTTPSLRSVFHNYVPRSQNTSTASMSRTPPTSTSAFIHGSYSPSNLGTGLRSSSIRRNSSTSDAGSGSAFGASVSSSSAAAAAAAAAKPQMIKRYSTNFSYRQNRERAGIYGSSLGSEASSSLGAGGEPSSYPRFGGAGGSLSSAYGRSWISRMEQRQGLGTGGAFARTSSLDDATAAATASSASRYRPISAVGATQMGGLTPSPRSHDEDMDDLVRLLESRPAFGTSSMGKLTSLRNERRNVPGLAAHLKKEPLLARVRFGRFGRFGGGIRTANPMSRSQLDDLLSRMAESVGILGPKEQGSTASGGTNSDVAASNDSRSDFASPAAIARPSATPLAPVSQSRTHSHVAAESVEKGRGSTGKGTEGAGEIPSSRLSSPGTLAHALPGEVGLRSRGAIGQQVRAYGTSAVRTASNRGAGENTSRSLRDNVVVPSSKSGVPKSQLTGSLEAGRMPEYEAEGDLMFKVDSQPEYDPEDELPGEMEMMPEEEDADTAVRSVESSGAAVFGGGVDGGMGATLPVGAHREARAHDWHVAERWERERAQEAERRRADAEMSRNFGQEVGASTRGRGSHSPWRTSTHSPQAAAVAVTTPQFTAGAGTGASTGVVGFRSSSIRPLKSTNRLVGVGVGSTGLSLASADGRRGYGVSAPSTQFYYQPSGRPSPAAQSNPVSRDEMYSNHDDEEEEDADD